jgi:hypothetical protein
VLSPVVNGLRRRKNVMANRRMTICAELRVLFYVTFIRSYLKLKGVGKNYVAYSAVGLMLHLLICGLMDQFLLLKVT